MQSHTCTATSNILC